MKLFDAHFHIIDDRFPLVENNGYLPPIFDTKSYTKSVENYGVIGGAIVSGSFQKFDQTYLIDALETLGDGFVGVANISKDMDLDLLNKLNDIGVVAVRFNVKRGGSEKIEELEKLSNQLFEQFGWHTELYIDSKDLKDLDKVLKSIPTFSIDHLSLSAEGLKDLYYYVEKGIKVKATGFGRIDFDPIPVMKTIHSINPEALLFGTDLPSTRANVPFSVKDIELVKQHFSEKDQNAIFYENALKWYGREK